MKKDETEREIHNVDWPARPMRTSVCPCIHLHGEWLLGTVTQLFVLMPHIKVTRWASNIGACPNISRASYPCLAQ